jgi:hypothetical protein
MLSEIRQVTESKQHSLEEHDRITMALDDGVIQSAPGALRNHRTPVLGLAR